MVLVVVGEELLHTRALVLYFLVRVGRVQARRAKNGGEGDVVSIRGEVDVHLVVHGVLVYGIDAKLDQLLNDLLLPEIVDDVDATVEADEQDVLVNWMELRR